MNSIKIVRRLAAVYGSHLTYQAKCLCSLEFVLDLYFQSIFVFSRPIDPIIFANILV
jgi:hypothetical protein